MSNKYHPLDPHLTKNLHRHRVALFGGTLTAYNFKVEFFFALHQAIKVMVLEKKWISTFVARVAAQTVSLPPNLPQNLVLLQHFLIRLTLNPHNFGPSGQNVIFFCPSPSHWVTVPGGKKFLPY